MRDDSLAVRIRRPAGDLQDTIDALDDAERAMLMNQRGEICPIDIFHHQEMPHCIFVGVIGHRDVRVAET